MTRALLLQQQLTDATNTGVNTTKNIEATGDILQTKEGNVLRIAFQNLLGVGQSHLRLEQWKNYRLKPYQQTMDITATNDLQCVHAKHISHILDAIHSSQRC